MLNERAVKHFTRCVFHERIYKKISNFTRFINEMLQNGIQANLSNKSPNTHGIRGILMLFFIMYVSLQEAMIYVL